MDCMRKPKKVSSSLNHRSFYSYGKPLKFLSRGLYEKTHKGFISKPLKLSVKPMSDLKERRELVWKFYYNYSWLFSATSIAHVNFHIKNNHVLLWWFSLGMCLIYFNPMFHFGRKQLFHSTGLKWIEAPYLKRRKQSL